MISPGDETAPWTEHYVEHGFAFVRGLLDASFCQQALERVREIVGCRLPLDEWNTGNVPTLYRPFFQDAGTNDPVLDRLFDQPRLRAAIESLFGGPGHWNEDRNYYLFLRTYNPGGTAALTPTGHIDFGSQPIPALYRGFTFQALLADNEPFSGNLTLHPGTHKLVQRVVIDDPARQFPSGLCDAIPQPPPVEFVGRAGDVCFMHHLIFHSGNDSHAARRSPRVALHAEAFRNEFLRELTPDNMRAGPWVRSIAHNGPCRPPLELEFEHHRRRNGYIADLRKAREAADAKT